MARRGYARGERAWGRCSRTGDRVLLRDMVRDGQTGLLVTREAYEPKHPQENAPEVFDPQVLRRPAPDTDVTGTFTTATFTWDPGSISDFTTEVKSDIDVQGALPGSTVIVYPGVDLGGLLVSGYVSAPGKVSVVLFNLTGAAVNLASSTWQVLVTSEIREPGTTLYAASFAWDPSSIEDGTTETKIVTVPGASVGDAVLVYPAETLNGALVSGYVSAADTVTVVLINFSGHPIELGGSTWPLWSVIVSAESSGSAFFQQTSLSGSFTWDPGSIVDGTTETTTATVTGAAVGDAVILYPGTDLSGMFASGYVSAADTVTAALVNVTGDDIDLTSSTWAARVLSQ